MRQFRQHRIYTYIFTILILGLSSILITCVNRNLSDSLPIDENIIKGTLDNGMTYYLYPSDEDEYKGTVYLQVTINAGSINETDEELGIAHFLEHIAFNSTKKYNQEQVAAMERELGIESGSHSNAYTNFDETNYFLSLQDPTPERLETMFDIMSQRTLHITFDPEEIERERGVVLGEKRLDGVNAYSKEYDFKFKMKLEGSLYAQRMPIGKTDIIKSATPELLQGFFEKWYRPKNMAVAVIGDISEEKAMPLLEKYFGVEVIRNTPDPPVISQVTQFNTPKYHVYVNPATFTTNISIENVYYESYDGSVQSLKQLLVKGMVHNFISNSFFRYLEDKKYDSALVDFYAYDEQLSAKNNLYFSLVHVTTFNNQLEKGVNEIQRFLATMYQELQKKETIERILKETYNVDYFSIRRGMKEYTPSIEEIAHSITSNFISGEPIVDGKKLFLYIDRTMKNITKDELVAWYQKLIYDPQNRHVFISFGEEYKDLVQEHSTSESDSLIQEVDLSRLFSLAPVLENKIDWFSFDEINVDDFISFKPPGRIIEEKKLTHEDDPTLILYTWKLDNGLTVLFRPLPDANGELEMTMYNPLFEYYFYKKNQHLFPVFSSAIDYSFYKDIPLLRLYSTKEFRNTSYFYYPGQLVVSAGKKGIASAFKLLNVMQSTLGIYGEPPLARAKITYLQDYRKKINNSFSYSYMLLDSLRDKNSSQYQDPFDESNIIDISLDDVKHMKNVWLNSKDNVVFIAGDAKPAKVKRLVKKWIASLPVKKSYPIDKAGFQYEIGPFEGTMTRNDRDDISLIMTLHIKQLHENEMTITYREEMLIELASRYVQDKVETRIREELGAAYFAEGYITKFVDANKIRGNYSLYTFAPPSVEEAEDVASEIDKVLESLAPVDKDLIEDIKKIMKRQIEEDASIPESAAVAVDTMKERYNRLPQLVSYDEMIEWLESITPQEVEDLIQMLLHSKKISLITMPASTSSQEEVLPQE